MEPALERLVLVDLSTGIAGPYAPSLLTDMGANSGLKFAVNYPRRIMKLVLGDAGGRGDEAQRAELLKSIQASIAQVGQTREKGYYYESERETSGDTSHARPVSLVCRTEQGAVHPRSGQDEAERLLRRRADRPHR